MSTTFADWIRERVPEILKNPFFVLEGWQWVSLVAIVLVGVVIDRTVRHILAFWLRRLLAKNAAALEMEKEIRLEQPVGILVMAFAWSGMMHLLDLPEGALTILTLAVRVVIAVSGVWASYRLADLLGAWLATMAARTESTLDDLLVPMVRRALKIIVTAFGLVFIAQNLNVDVTSLLAGLGIGGLAFALAAKDTIENLFGSLTVLADRPFKIGDWVVIGDLEGTVEELGLRSTRIRTFYNSLITVPNSNLVNTAVDNYGERSYRRISTVLSVQYDTPPETIEAFCEGIRELIRLHPYTRKDFYLVNFDRFDASSLGIRLYCFHEAPDWGTELRERQRLYIDILYLARKLGVEFAFPTQTLHVSSLPDTPQVVPPGDPATLQAGIEAAKQVVDRTGSTDREAPVQF
ncbi:MAG: mechanosensitive ion channel family protein [Acidobacteria bacterium]|uniref:Mechanosensitive ion channel family protein n=1 Tax=Candidatus Polarisedimenticola svalbardensis TaxID=2886004 RepID=A0A8J6Y2K0_9BACT|nr:mechanosensitive ion channel family protein [Candidatus Polarisedimenticola svalbardensis]